MSLPPTYVKGFHNTEKCRKMEYRKLGATDLVVSKVSLGGCAFTRLYGDVNEDEAALTIHDAIKSGINYVDTAPWYGQGKCEELFGKALANIPRSAYYIATKIGRYELEHDKMFDFSAKKTRESVENSLQLLGLDYVDVVEIHDIEFAPNLYIVLHETLPVLEELVKEGKARYIGITGYRLDTLMKLIRFEPHRFNTLLCYARYTLLDSSLSKHLDFFKKHKLGVICAAGHGLGLLTNAGPPSWHPAPQHIKDLCKKAAKICRDTGIELAKLATFYFLQLDGPDTFLTGVRTRRELSVNLEAYFNGLSNKEQEVLQYLKENIFTKSMNWEGIELEAYWNEYKRKQIDLLVN